LTAEQWRSDVKFLGDELPRRHRNAFHRMKRYEYEAAVKNLYDAVPSLSEDEVVVGMMRVVAMVHDGHTQLIPMQRFRSGIYPIRPFFFTDGLYIVKAAPKYADLVGTRILRIGRMSVEDAIKAAGPIASADNEMGVKALAPLFLTVPEVLSGLKIVDRKGSVELVVDQDGRQRTVIVEPQGSVEDAISPPAAWVDAAKGAPVPLYMSRGFYGRHSGEMYWFEYVKDKKLFYIQHNEIGSKPGLPVDDFYRRALAAAEASGADKLVLDIRNNGGGNNTLNKPVVVGLIRSRFNQRGRLFVITGRETFSAAQNLTNQIEKYTEAIFVGEPTGGHPNHYGDSRPFTLPNSGLTVRASSLWWQDLDPRDERRWTAPEIAAEVSFKDYAAGRDPALDAALAYTPGSSVSELIQTAATGTVLGDFAARYRKVKADPRSKYVDSEAAVNRLGYTLLRKNRVADAIEVFRLNVEFYPGSANVHDSLGDALTLAGKKEEAIKSYEKALSVDPTYASSIESLKKLKGN
jgi:tetratricopeptide (TPR) repeat protein